MPLFPVAFLGATRFGDADIEDAGGRNLSYDVNTVSQAAAFLMPLGHDSDLDDSDWNWQTRGGGFTRWQQREDLRWAFGVYFDVGSDEDFYIPYLGA